MSKLKASIFRPITACLTIVSMVVVARGAEEIEFHSEPDRVIITAGNQPIATYVYADQEISRPYFAHVHVPGAVQVTRNYPPKVGVDLVDHGTFHPGIWMAFGDLDGQDYWRNKGRVRHERFIEPPKANGSTGFFTVQNSYCRIEGPDQIVCQETCRYTISIEPTGYLLICDSAFRSPKEFAFGDQEEMGLGIRLATPITVKSGGKITDAFGRVNEKGIWGKSSPWCDYSGQIHGRKVGILVMSDEANFRPSRYHVRDYGLLTSNPFGQKVFGDQAASRVVVPANETFRLRFGMLLHANTDQELDRQAAFDRFLSRLKGLPRPTH